MTGTHLKFRPEKAEERKRIERYIDREREREGGSERESKWELGIPRRKWLNGGDESKWKQTPENRNLRQMRSCQIESLTSFPVCVCVPSSLSLSLLLCLALGRDL